MTKAKKVLIPSTLISLLLLWVVLLVGVLALSTVEKFFSAKHSSDSQCEESALPSESLPVSGNVLRFYDVVLKHAKENGIEEYVNLILALMMQETGGDTSKSQDVFQCAESLGIPRSQITLDQSIEHGVALIAERLKAAKVTSPSDILRIKLAIQSYNFGGGYIPYAMEHGGGWTQENTDSFAEKYSHGRQNSKERAKVLGKWRYGDQHYTDHVLRYYVCPDASSSPEGGGENSDVVDYAKTLLGKPYVLGAAGPDAFDCSGLVYYVFKQTGVYNGERTTASGYSKIAKPISKADAKPGDLVFFRNSKKVHHVAIYIGNNQVIHAPKPGDVVKIVKIWRTTDKITYGRLEGVK